MTDMFLSIENKGLLWQLLVESNAFSNIPNEHFERVKNLFEATLKEINSSNLNLTDKNKTVIMHMMKKLPFLKNQSLVKPLEEVNIKINEDFKNKQEEFINLVNHKPPSKPKFIDEMIDDTPLDPTKMNNMLNQMMTSREKELDQIQPVSPKNILNKELKENSKENSKESLKKEYDTEEYKQPLSNSNGTYVDSMWSQENKEINKSLHSKKVSFETDDFISKLKRVEFKESGLESELESGLESRLESGLESELEQQSSKVEIALNIVEDKKDIFITNLKSCISNQENSLIQLKSLLNLII